MGAKLQTNFDTTPIVAESVSLFNTAFDTRFKAALPDSAAQAACRREATPVPQLDFGSYPAVAKPRPTSNAKPSEDPALQGVVTDFTAPATINEGRCVARTFVERLTSSVTLVGVATWQPERFGDESRPQDLGGGTAVLRRGDGRGFAHTR
jgi:hypothetical protein